MRVGIIGAGGAGAMAAWRCAAAGHDVAVFEQFALDHDLGSSYGDSRIVRRVYADPLYTELMARAYALWDEFQAAASHEELFARSGGVFVGPRGHPELVAAQEVLTSSGVPFDVLGPEACAERFPAFQIRENEIALYEPSMGVARASSCVRTASRLAQDRGAVLREQTSVRSIAPNYLGTGVRIALESGDTIAVDRAIVCAGPWSDPFLRSIGIRLPLKITRQTYAYFPVPEIDAYAPGRFPVWIDAATYDYGFPRLGADFGVKVACHRQGQAVSPPTVERTLSPADLASLALTAEARVVGIGSQPLHGKVCLYSNTPDEDFILDRCPGVPDALIISACSGHGFKFTPLLGQIAADFASSGALPPGFDRFRLARF